MDPKVVGVLVVVLVVAILSSIPLISCFSRNDRLLASQTDSYYCDEDGEATVLARQIPGERLIRKSVAGCSLIGLILISTISFWVTANESNKDTRFLVWCQFACWILSCLQASVFFIEASIIQRFKSAHYAFWSSLGLIALAVSDEAYWTGNNLYQDTTMFALQNLIIISAGFRAVSCLMLPRRPDVYAHGKIVDREHTVSLWSRLTFGYVTPFLIFVGRNQSSLAIDDFPQLPCYTRSEFLHDTLQNELHHGRTLFQALCHAHLPALALQAMMGIGYALMSFGPQVALYGILRSLEEGWFGSPGVWVAALGVTMFLSSSLNSWLWCITYSKLAIPIYSELVALLYAKSMRKEDIQHVNSATDTLDASKVELQQAQQEAINLVTIDTKRISEYISYNHLIPSSVTQFIVGCGLLWYLIGWQSLLASLAANILTAPGNFFIAKEYRVFQIGLMQARDQRTAIIHEVVKNIRQVKFSSSESSWEERVLEVRAHEMGLNLKACFYETGFKAIWTLAPLLLSVVSLTIYALQNGRLEASVAFTSIAIFGSLEVALSALPHLISTALEAKISVDRIDEFMRGPEKILRQSNASKDIVFKDATVAWPVSESSKDVGFRMSQLSLKFPHGGLSIVTGQTGSGKSLLLSTILGECSILSGAVQVPSAEQGVWRHPSNGDWIIDSAIAYVAQNPWIENGTIRDNILFDLPFDPIRYRKVLFASGLERDIDILADGDRTEIGANGVNISGGQRARISFARALYSRAGILVMDDIFSALDADTCQHVYEHGLTSDLASNRTRILATHTVSLCLPRTDYCVVLADGRMGFAGSVEELRKTNFLADYLTEENQKDGNDSQQNSSVDSDGRDLKDGSQEVQKFVLEEQRAIGAVPFALYKKFLTGENVSWLWSLGLLASLMYTIFFFGRSWWLNVWTNDANQGRATYYMDKLLLAANTATREYQTLKAPKDLLMYIGVYIGLSLAASLLGTLRFLFIRMASLRSSQALFKNFLSAVMRAPLRWVDTMPLGRVLNRFTADVYTLDWLLGPDLAELLMYLLQTVGVLVASVSVSPVVLAPAAVLMAASLKLAAIYLAAAREVKRLESISRTPVLEQFTSTLVGLTTIRAFDHTQKYIHLMFARIDGYSSVSRNLWLLNWWLQVRINFLGAVFSSIVAVIVVKLGISASLAGFAIGFLLQYSTAVSSMIRNYTNFEMNMNATERIIDYTNIETEPQGGLDPPAGWPTQGRMSVHNLVIGYSPELAPVLKGLTFTVENNQRVGIVGRTGSGKSTLALALFRFLEAREGQVFLDGIDTSKIRLHALRRGMAIVPQFPTLFKGTIRSNLDPFGWYSETEMRDALERVHLVSEERALATSFSLETPVSEGGANFSQGQRQLLCLARAILQRAKVMVLDEATSAVDLETDGHIQHAIRSEFGRNMSSLLVVAHRLSTIVDFDHILVMDEGRIVESGSPRELSGIAGGVFRGLMDQSSEKALLEKIIMGQEKP